MLVLGVRYPFHCWCSLSTLFSAVLCCFDKKHPVTWALCRGVERGELPETVRITGIKDGKVFITGAIP